MSPSPLGPHEQVVSELALQLGDELIASGCSWRVYTYLDQIVSSDAVIRPGLVVLCGDDSPRRLARPPQPSRGCIGLA